MIETLARDRRAVFATRTDPRATTVIIAVRIVAGRTRAGRGGAGEPVRPRSALARDVMGVWFRSRSVSAMSSAGGSAPSSLRTRA